MKIAIDISQICYEGSGVATYMTLLVENLLRYDKENDYLLVGNSLRQYSKLDEFYKYCLKINPIVKSKFFYLPQTFSTFLTNNIHFPDLSWFIGKVDIFHSSDWQEPLISSKKVTTVHDLVILKYPQYSDPGIVSNHKKKLKWVKDESNVIISDSFSTKQDLTDLLCFDKNRIEVVYPGIEEMYRPSDDREKERIKSKYGLTDEYILAVGTLEPRKNLRMSISAFEIFAKHPLIKSLNKPVQMIIVGKKGWGSELKPVKNVKFLGIVDKIDLPGLYSGAKIFIYPSFYEGFGLPVLEAFASGCPVITSKRGSLMEISQDVAVFVDPDDLNDISIKLVKLFIDRELRAGKIKKGLLRAKDFTWENTARKMVEIYKKVNKS